MNELDKVLQDVRAEDPVRQHAIKQIKRINENCQTLSAAASSVTSSMDSDLRDHEWKKVYDEIFRTSLKNQVEEAARLIGPSFKWDRPDTSYEDDVSAFITALKDYTAKL